MNQEILITSSCFISTEEKKQELLLWSRLTRHLNLDTPILLVDSASPRPPSAFARDVNIHIRQEENIGHPMTGGDGWGRDLCHGINFAAERGFRWLVFIESDMMLARPVAPIIKKLERLGAYAAAPISFQYHWIETGIMFLYVPMLVITKFVERYSWHTHRPPFLCEPHVERLLAEELSILPLRGARNDGGTLNPQNLQSAFPMGLDYLTHGDLDLYRMFLQLNGLPDLVPASPARAR
jgi:hypothetical protein